MNGYREEMFEADPELVRVDRESSSVVVRLMLTFDQAADDFLGDCERRGFRPRSVATYRRTYDQFADRLPIATDVSKITTDDIRRYLNSKNHLAPGTRAGIESHLAALFDWLIREDKIARNPMLPIGRTKRLPSEDLDVTMVSTAQVKMMFAVTENWTERLCLGVLAYLGPRRHAVAMLRLSDYDEVHHRIRFHEKGGKTIWKPIPHELVELIRAARLAGVYEDSLALLADQDHSADPYLIPPRGKLVKIERDDRVIWHLVKLIADRAGVKCHTHALRAAFIVYYLETHPGDQLGAQMLAGHRSPATTQIYQRKLDKGVEMERVRDLSWGVPVGGNDETHAPSKRPEEAQGLAAAAGDDPHVDLAAPLAVAAAGDATEQIQPQIASNRFDEDRLVGAGGFEPPEAEDPHQQTPHTKHLDAALAERLDQAVSERRAEGREAVQTHEGGAS